MADKRKIIRAALLAALAISAIALGWVCLGPRNPTIVEIEAPPRATQTPATPTSAPDAPSLPLETEAPELNTSEQEKGQADNSAATNRLGTLTIGNKEIPIASDVDESTLEKSPGWMPDSALPGESGMCVILGHRNRKHLRPLEKVKLGDSISFTYPDGRTAAYTVCETMVYQNTADWRLPAVDGDTLVLVTCWPFQYSGNAPGKYVVLSRILDNRPWQ